MSALSNFSTSLESMFTIWPTELSRREAWHDSSWLVAHRRVARGRYGPCAAAGHQSRGMLPPSASKICCARFRIPCTAFLTSARGMDKAVFRRRAL